MQINDIKTLVARLGAIVDGWDEQSGAPAVERHIAASLLAELYEAVKFDTALAATEVAKVVAEPEPAEEFVAEPTEEVAEVIDLSDIFGGSFGDDDEEVVEQEVAEQPIEEVAEPEPEIEPEQEPEPEPEIEEQPEVEIEQEEVQSEEEQVLEDDEDKVEQPVEIEVQPVVEEEEQPVEIETQPVVEEVEQSIETEEQPAEIEEEKQPTEIEEEEQPAMAEAEKPKSEQASLFDMEIVRRPRSSSGRRVIMSLYGESATSSSREEKTREKAVEPAPDAIQPDAIQPVEQPADESPKAVSVAERIAAAQTEGPQVLGDVIGAGTTTLAEAVAASQPTVQTVQNDRVNTLRAAIGINDRFIMIRDLFGGDGAAFDRAMDELDAFEDFNECLVYMSTYRWNPNSDGARMLMDLVTRKLL